MSKKIYNKGALIWGILLLALAVINTFLIIINYKSYSQTNLIESAIVALLCITLGIVDLFKSTKKQ